jgi:hypothetical protein
MALPAKEDGSRETTYAGTDNNDVEPIGLGSGSVAIGDCMRDAVGFHDVIHDGTARNLGQQK